MIIKIRRNSDQKLKDQRNDLQDGTFPRTHSESEMGGGKKSWDYLMGTKEGLASTVNGEEKWKH